MSNEIMRETNPLNVGAIDIHPTYAEASEINYLLKKGDVEAVCSYMKKDKDILKKKDRKLYDKYIEKRETYFSMLKNTGIELVNLWSPIAEVEFSPAHIRQYDKHFMTMDRTGEVPKQSEYFDDYKSYIEQLDVAFLSGSYGSKCVYSAAIQMKQINSNLVIVVVDGPTLWGVPHETIYDGIGEIIPTDQIKNEIEYLSKNYKIN